MTYDIASETLQIPGLSKTRLTDVLDISRKGKITIQLYTKARGCLSRREDITKKFNWEFKALLSFCHV